MWINITQNHYQFSQGEKLFLIATAIIKRVMSSEFGTKRKDLTKIFGDPKFKH